MKMFFYSTLLAVALLFCAGCEGNTQGSDEKKSVTVLATLENGREWKAGDEVVINNIKYTVEVGGTSTVSIEDVVAADYYYAAYDFGNGTIDNTTLAVDLPATQSPSISMIRPMVASNGNTKLVFKNLLGTLRLSLSGSGVVNRVVLSSLDTALAGHGVANMDFAGAPQLEIANDGTRSITVDLGQGVTLPADVDVVLPAMTYSGFVLTVYGANDAIMSGYTISSTEVLRGDIQMVNVNYEPDTEAPTYLTATVENDAEGNPYTWTAASMLYVNGTPTQIAGGQGTANGEFGPVSSAEVYYASTSSASANGMSGQTMRIAIPTTQRYNAALATINPAVAKSTTNNLSLNYLCGVATVKITGPHILRQVTLAGKNNRRLAGSGVVDLSTETARLSLNADAAKELSIDCGTAGVNVENGATFRFVLPAEDYSEGFTLTMLDTNGQTMSMEIAGGVIARNSVTALSDVEWLSAQGDNNNLSRMGCANCYMVHMAGDYTFRTRYVDNTPVSNIAKVDWLWATKVEGKEGNALISNINYADGVVSFTASEYEGNAVLAAFDAAGEIIWSWHIWLTDMPAVYDDQNNYIEQSGGLTDGYYCMDRNLGATDATALGGYETFGLYYQWGRKDPFVGDATEERARDVQNGGWMNVTAPFGNSSSLTVCNSAYTQAAWSATATSAAIGSIEYATANPMTFLTGDPTSNKADWLNLNNLGAEKNNIIYDADKSLWRPFQKSNYDPCPVGYQVPRKAMWVSLLSTNCVHTEYKGFVNTTDSGQSVWYPSAGYRSAHPSDAGALMSVQNDTGFVKLWSSELEASELSFCFTFNYPLYNAINSASWGNGYNVRCVKAY